MDDNMNITLDSSESIENETNDTIPWYDSVGNSTDIIDQVDELQWASPEVWLTVILVLFGLLVLINILVYKLCLKAVSRSLSDTFNDIIFLACSLFFKPHPHPAEDDDEPSVLYKNNTTTVDFIDGFRPSPFCCFRDNAHEESETLGRLRMLEALTISRFDNDADEKPQKPDRKREKEESTVDLRIKVKNEVDKEKSGEEETKDVDLRGETENTPVEENKGKRVGEEQKAVDEKRMKMENRLEQRGTLERCCMGNGDVAKNLEKVSKKAQLQSVPEEQAVPVERGIARIGNLAELMYAVVVKPSPTADPPAPAADDAGTASDPEIFI